MTATSNSAHAQCACAEITCNIARARHKYQKDNQQYTRMASTKRLWRMSEAVSEKANELSENIDISSPEGEVCVDCDVAHAHQNAI